MVCNGCLPVTALPLEVTPHAALTTWRTLALVVGTPALAQPATAPAAAAAPAPAPTQRLRGTVQSFDGSTRVITERRGALLRLVLADNFSVSEVLPIALDAIQAGSFVGTAAMPAANGTLQALEVLVFPESARGSGEGHFPWDL